jgi:hypothetical protein
VKSVPQIHPDIRELVDRVVVPALLDRFLREHSEGQPRVEAPATEEVECRPT